MLYSLLAITIDELGTLTERLHSMIKFQSNELLRPQIHIMNLTMFLWSQESYESYGRFIC